MCRNSAAIAFQAHPIATAQATDEEPAFCLNHLEPRRMKAGIGHYDGLATRWKYCPQLSQKASMYIRMAVPALRMNFFVKRDRASFYHHARTQQLSALIFGHIGPIHHDQDAQQRSQPALRKTPVDVAMHLMQRAVAEQTIHTLQAVFQCRAAA